MSQTRQRMPVVVGSRHGTIWALDPETGKTLWSRVTGDNLGQLVQTDEIVYVVSHADHATPRVSLSRDSLLAPGHHWFPGFHFQTVRALRSHDGKLLWERQSYAYQVMRLNTVVDNGILLMEETLPKEETNWIQALDAGTGDPLWKVSTGPLGGRVDRLHAARGGKAFIVDQGDRQRLHVLDIHSGQFLWAPEDNQAAYFVSEGGELLGQLSIHDDPTNSAQAGESARLTMGLFRASTGEPVAQLASPYTSLLALTDDGIGFSWRHRRSWSMCATRLTDGAEVWRTEGISINSLVLVHGVLYYSRLPQASRLAEVGALDAQTGRVLWQWTSPGRYGELLKLWGTRTPSVLIDGLRRGWRLVTYARETGQRNIMRKEIRDGQWRHPGAITAPIHLSADTGSVYLSTEMGLYALNAHDGSLRWLALPSHDLSSNEGMVWS